MGEAARPDDRLRGRLPRILGAAALMGLCLVAAEAALGPRLYAGSLRYAALALLVALGLVSYAGAALALGALSLRELRGALRR